MTSQNARQYLSKPQAAIVLKLVIAVILAIPFAIWDFINDH